MDVQVASYIRAGKRVLSSECIQCQLCVNNCARSALRLSFGLDRGQHGLSCTAPAPALATAGRASGIARALTPLVLLLGLLALSPSASASEPLPLQLRADAFTEAAAIPFTRLTGRQLNPGATLGVDWVWLDWWWLSLYQTGYASFYSHEPVQSAGLIGSEGGVRLTAPFGGVAELGLGVAYMHTFSASPRYEKGSDGRYAQVTDWGRPRFAPTFRLGVGYDFSRQHDLPLALLLQYGHFSEMPHSVMTAVMPHVTLGLGLRFSPDWRMP